VTTPSSSSAPVRLDGSHGEGGGQILRTALSLSLLTGRPFRIDRIRANRDKPGLRPQHLAAVRAAALLSNAHLTGAEVSSTQLTFHPQEFAPRDLEFEIGTAGATALVLHTLALPLALRAQAPVRLALTGGTFNEKAPSFPFLHSTWTRDLAALGLSISVAMPLAGFYPRGGGRLEAWIEPGHPTALTRLNLGPLLALNATAGSCRLPAHVTERMRQRLESALAEHGHLPEIDEIDWPGIAPGAACALVARYEHSTLTAVGLGARGKPAEQVADEAIHEFLAFDRAEGAVDPHSADQLLLPLALAEGRSVFTTTEATEHLRTNARTIAAFLDRPIRIEEHDSHSVPTRVIVG
jgi:RNA 3'-terminal phosphate cyclase (ATP)